MLAALAGGLLFVGGLVLIFASIVGAAKRVEGLERYELEHRNDAGVVQFESPEVQKAHEELREHGGRTWRGACLAAIGVLAMATALVMGANGWLSILHGR